jgi:hypothetical protein
VTVILLSEVESHPARRQGSTTLPAGRFDLFPDRLQHDVSLEAMHATFEWVILQTRL